jgi:hypothetical protein
MSPAAKKKNCVLWVHSNRCLELLSCLHELELTCCMQRTCNKNLKFLCFTHHSLILLFLISLFFFAKKRNYKFSKIMWISRFSVIKIEENLNKNCRIPYLIFSGVIKNIKSWLNICTSYLVYSQIWLNFPKMIAIFSTSSYGWSPLWLQTKLPKNNTVRFSY